MEASKGDILEMMPELLISAADETTALNFANELSENKVEEDSDSLGVWRLNNKYYTAPVRLRFSADESVVPAPATLAPAGAVEAHVVVVGASEWAQGEALLTARARAAGSEAAGVRLAALCAAPAQSATRRQQLRCAAAQLGLEPVALPADSDDDEDDADSRSGWRRAREALHAHRWPGLRMRSSGDEVVLGEDDDADADDSLRRAELLGEALAELGRRGGLREGGCGPPEGETAAQREARLRRAEALVQAFCLALADSDSEL